MGGKISKPQLQRNKSLSNIGRSSQRSLFQKSKLKLNQIQKKLGDANEDELKSELDSIETELGNISGAIKEKNKEKYDSIIQQLQEARQQFDERFKPQVNEVKKTEPPAEVVEVHNAEPEVEVRKPPINLYTRPESPKIKFGVQVMPTMPRVSQEMLRNTLPTSVVAKEEFTEIRAHSVIPQTVIHSTSVVEENGVIKSVSRVTSVEENPNLNMIEKISLCIDELEGDMKYFHGVKGDSDYDQLHQNFIQNLVKLDNYDVNENPVLKQDKKILIMRIQELLNILERLGAPVGIVVNENQKEDFRGDPSIGTPI